MTEDPTALALREALWLTIQLAWPPLLAMLAIGLIVSVLQAVTQVQEATLAFLPKLLVLAVVLLVTGPGMTLAMQGYAGQLYDRIVALGGQGR
ncbi:flagellar biosynthetic protein FliQ [Paracraurococcus ruber]|uniref:Flagellar biosynthetic protein FliQ n=1 Tax=Paracraurococcus ruber TaxID=77675 RepID=A0ABS1D796_9PROT|nr:flagellar biosynthetic protein FliQ [Paracraurococcus ruber]MBK1661744.1 flagellar biosynthetic protein FliQ [Paracraurococcus ruber]TDG17935.1 flagellar type III secretion system protein FliQ [Paracraurococcus ruber]